MYMSSFIGGNFGVHETIDGAKQDAENHAKENSRKKGDYTISKVTIMCGDLVRKDLTEKTIKGIKKGKTITWES